VLIVADLNPAFKNLMGTPAEYRGTKIFVEHYLDPNDLPPEGLDAAEDGMYAIEDYDVTREMYARAAVNGFVQWLILQDSSDG